MSAFTTPVEKMSQGLSSFTVQVRKTVDFVLLGALTEVRAGAFMLYLLRIRRARECHVVHGYISQIGGVPWDIMRSSCRQRILIAVVK